MSGKRAKKLSQRSTTLDASHDLLLLNYPSAGCSTTAHSSTQSASTMLNLPCEKVFNDAFLTGTLNLCSRQLKEFPNHYAQCYDITDLVNADLSNNCISELPACVCEWHSLETLKLHSNCLRSIPVVISSLQSLTFLDLSNNHLSALPSSLFTLPLQVLLLSGNRLEILNSDLKNLGETLQELDLRSNRLRQLPAAIALLTELRVLNLKSNQLKDLPGEIGCLNLRILDVTSNMLIRLPVELHKLSDTCMELFADGNPLMEPPMSVVQRGSAHIFKWLSNRAEQQGTYQSHFSLSSSNFSELKLGSVEPQPLSNAQNGAMYNFNDHLDFTRVSNLNATIRRSDRASLSRNAELQQRQQKHERRSRSIKTTCGSGFNGTDSGYITGDDQHQYYRQELMSSARPPTANGHITYIDESTELNLNQTTKNGTLKGGELAREILRTFEQTKFNGNNIKFQTTTKTTLMDLSNNNTQLNEDSTDFSSLRFATNSAHLSATIKAPLEHKKLNGVSENLKSNVIKMEAKNDDEALKKKEVVLNGKPLKNEVVLNGKPSNQDESLNGKPSNNEVVSNGNPPNHDKSLNGKPSNNDKSLNGKPSNQNESSNGKTSNNEVISNGKPSNNKVVLNGKPSNHDESLNGKTTENKVPFLNTLDLKFDPMNASNISINSTASSQITVLNCAPPATTTKSTVVSKPTATKPTSNGPIQRKASLKQTAELRKSPSRVKKTSPETKTVTKSPTTEKKPNGVLDSKKPLKVVSSTQNALQKKGTEAAAKSSVQDSKKSTKPVVSNAATRPASSRQQTPTSARRPPPTTTMTKSTLNLSKSRTASTMSLAQNGKLDPKTKSAMNGSRLNMAKSMSAKVQPVGAKEPLKVQTQNATTTKPSTSKPSSSSSTTTMSKSVISTTSSRPNSSATNSTTQNRTFKKAGSVDSTASTKPPAIKEESPKNSVELLRQHLTHVSNNQRLEVNAEKLAQQLADGVILCLFINSLSVKGGSMNGNEMVSSIVRPTTITSSLSVTRARRNVENFVSACRELGVPESSMCHSTDILERKNLLATAKTISFLAHKFSPTNCA